MLSYFLTKKKMHHLFLRFYRKNILSFLHKMGTINIQAALHPKEETTITANQASQKQIKTLLY